MRKMRVNEIMPSIPKENSNNSARTIDGDSSETAALLLNRSYNTNNHDAGGNYLGFTGSLDHDIDTIGIVASSLESTNNTQLSLVNTTEVEISNESPLPKYDDTNLLDTKMKNSNDFLLSSENAQLLSGRIQRNDISPESQFANDSLPPAPEPPTANTINTSDASYVPTIIYHNQISTVSSEEPKYAKVEIKNKRNSKQISNGTSSNIEMTLEGNSNA